MLDRISVRGARQHNLQGFDIEIPRDRLTVVTGLSGSGKSSLAFDTIYAEGQRRYVETLSPYARQFLEKLERPDVDSIDGLSPALSIEQKTAGRSRRSTVGTVTEVYDYLRVLFSAAGTPHCVKCDLPIRRQSADRMVSRIFRDHEGRQVSVLAPVVRGRKGRYRKQLRKFARMGFVAARIDGELERLDTSPLEIRLKRNKSHTIEVIVDRVRLRTGALKRFTNSIKTASKLAGGLVLILWEDGTESLYSEKLACVECGASMPEVEPRTFSFNSRYGACEACRGLGMAWDVDPAKLIVRPDKPLYAGAWTSKKSLLPVLRRALNWAEHVGIDVDRPWNDLDPEDREWLLNGFDGDLPRTSILRKINYEGMLEEARFDLRIWPGRQPRKEVAPYMEMLPCPECGGRRLKPEALAVKVCGHSISEMAQMTVGHLGALLRGLVIEGHRRAVAASILGEITKRVEFLDQVGLGYLSLDRVSSTLSGGEAQRVRLATQVGTKLRGVLYVLDEPSIGLHGRDQRRLLDTLFELRDLGNTVIVVEHDGATIESADHVVDIGPGAGRLGGHIIAQGAPNEIASNEASLTGNYLAGRLLAHVPADREQDPERQLVVRGARQHNLKNLDVPFPLGNFCVVTGVSGSGKSTLVNSILYPALANAYRRRSDDKVLSIGDHDAVTGLEQVDKVVRIDQSPIGRTPRSNPATYTGVFTPIRSFYALLPEARARGYKPGRFSFNVHGGRCDACNGDGFERIEMNFLPDVFVKCETCRGRRYNRETLQVRYKGHSIADLLESTVEEVIEIMKNLPNVRRKLQTLLDVGLGYIQLGQSSTTISGGEAQRMKLARELSKRQTGRTVYILDEPTTGLHFDDVRKLLLVLRRLVGHGNTVIVIEHQMDVIRSADWIVDLGPEGGDEGGHVVCAGPPAAIAASETSHTGRLLREAGGE